MHITRIDSELRVFAATIYAEVGNEPEEIQIWLGWIIKNRARKNRQYWGGKSIKSVCLFPNQFECWNGMQPIDIKSLEAFHLALRIAHRVMQENEDPTEGCDHFNNPNKDVPADWMKNVKTIKRINNHVFYREK
jgi:spore germination cell wall hydrolase CwlJ-like protein